MRCIRTFICSESPRGHPESEPASWIFCVFGPIGSLCIYFSSPGPQSFGVGGERGEGRGKGWLGGSCK